MPMAGGLAWQAGDGKLREHGSWRPGILSHRIGVRKSTSGSAACSVTERCRCGRLSRRASMMPILSGWTRQTYATTLLRNVKGKMGTMAALQARKIILAHRRRGRASACSAFNRHNDLDKIGRAEPGRAGSCLEQPIEQRRSTVPRLCQFLRGYV